MKHIFTRIYLTLFIAIIAVMDAHGAIGVRPAPTPAAPQQKKAAHAVNQINSNIKNIKKAADEGLIDPEDAQEEIDELNEEKQGWLDYLWSGTRKAFRFYTKEEIGAARKTILSYPSRTNRISKALKKENRMHKTRMENLKLKEERTAETKRHAKKVTELYTKLEALKTALHDAKVVTGEEWSTLGKVAAGTAALGAAAYGGHKLYKTYEEKQATQKKLKQEHKQAEAVFLGEEQAINKELEKERKQTQKKEERRKQEEERIKQKKERIKKQTNQPTIEPTGTSSTPTASTPTELPTTTSKITEAAWELFQQGNRPPTLEEMQEQQLLREPESTTNISNYASGQTPTKPLTLQERKINSNLDEIARTTDPERRSQLEKQNVQLNKQLDQIKAQKLEYQQIPTKILHWPTNTFETYFNPQRTKIQNDIKTIEEEMAKETDPLKLETLRQRRDNKQTALSKL
jgi:hypothetical protein